MMRFGLIDCLGQLLDFSPSQVLSHVLARGAALEAPLQGSVTS